MKGCINMKRSLRFVSVIAIILSAALLFSGCSEERKQAVANYDRECTRINAERDDLEKVIAESQKLIDSHEEPYDKTTVTTLETAVADSRAAIVEIPKKRGNAKEINELVNEKLKKISYVETKEVLDTAKTNLENSIRIMKQLTNPSEAFTIERIRDIDTITGYAGVTEDNDPNGNLNKPGGYTSTVYFASSQIKAEDREWLDGTIIDNGTDGGGSIEVYVTREDAEKRCEYLAQFDGSRLASGSHRVVGTVLVRTSDCLTASQQKKLEAEIVANLTELRD